jgi:hypothetical protein
MRKSIIKILMITMALALALVIAVPVFAGTGSIKTTDVDGNAVDGNIYTFKTDVYVGGENLPEGSYYVQVTTPNGDLLGKTQTASETVGADGILPRVQLWSILSKASDNTQGYDNTTNPGGEYKVWVSTDSTFPNNESKKDNFKVAGPSEPVPELPSVLLFGLGLLGVAGFIAKKKLVKA